MVEGYIQPTKHKSVVYIRQELSRKTTASYNRFFRRGQISRKICDLSIFPSLAAEAPEAANSLLAAEWCWPAPGTSACWRTSYLPSCIYPFVNLYN